MLRRRQTKFPKSSAYQVLQQNYADAPTPCKAMKRRKNYNSCRANAQQKLGEICCTFRQGTSAGSVDGGTSGWDVGGKPGFTKVLSSSVVRFCTSCV